VVSVNARRPLGGNRLGRDSNTEFLSRNRDIPAVYLRPYPRNDGAVWRTVERLSPTNLSYQSSSVNASGWWHWWPDFPG